MKCARLAFEYLQGIVPHLRNKEHSLMMQSSEDRELKGHVIASTMKHNFSMLQKIRKSSYR